MNVYDTKNRDLLILQLLGLIQDLTGRKELTNEDKAIKVKQVKRLWIDIPTTHLESSVMAALQAHNKNFPFAYLEVVSAWNEIKDSVAQQNAGDNVERQENLSCPHCKGIGMIYLDKVVNGRAVKAVTQCKNKCKSTTNLSQERTEMPPEIKEALKLSKQKILEEKRKHPDLSGWSSVGSVFGNLALDKQKDF